MDREITSKQTVASTLGQHSRAKPSVRNCNTSRFSGSAIQWPWLRVVTRAAVKGELAMYFTVLFSKVTGSVLLFCVVSILLDPRQNVERLLRLRHTGGVVDD